MKPAKKTRAQLLAENAERRAKRRLSTRHQALICEMIRAQLLPSRVNSGLTEAEHRKLRNALKALRRKHRP